MLTDQAISEAAGCVDWFDAGGCTPPSAAFPPAEFEAAYYAQTQPDSEAGPNTLKPPRNPRRFATPEKGTGAFIAQWPESGTTREA